MFCAPCPSANRSPVGELRDVACCVRLLARRAKSDALKYFTWEPTMATWQVALVREQGIEFAVVCVRDSVINDPSQRDQLVRAWTFELVRPAVLLGERQHRLYGRNDIVRFLSNVHLSQLPWRQMTLAA